MAFDLSYEAREWNPSAVNMKKDDTRKIIFASFGGAVLDEISVGERVVARDSLGGAGTHATLGARLFIQPQDKAIAWSVPVGDGLPAQVEEKMESWRILLSLRRSPDVFSTRNRLKYHDETLGEKTFQYLTPVTSTTPRDVEGTILLAAQTFHFHVPPEALQQQVQELLMLVKPKCPGRPMVLWEPTRPSCVANSLKACLEATKMVDVFSPSHDELAALHNSFSHDFQQDTFEQLARFHVDAGIGSDGHGIIVVRAGEHGSLVHSKGMAPTWVPAFHEPIESGINPKVVDTTGAGNSFLGGFAVGLLESGDPVVAVQYGSVAASYMVEQIGLPDITYDEDGSEQWNGTNVRDRLKTYQARFAACPAVGSAIRDDADRLGAGRRS
jgi:sugar/nucleoside kinase (ribokinase family)